MWKVDSRNITNFNSSKGELQAQIIFWILAAGKTAKNSEKILTKLLFEKYLPFYQLDKNYPTQTLLSRRLKQLGCGCFNNKARSIHEIVNSGLNLKKCSVEDLENIYGIGRKTSRAFILHTRRDANVAVLDVHILKFLKEKGISDVPKNTPSSKLVYNRLETEFLDICKKKKISPAEYDLTIWKSYAV